MICLSSYFFLLVILLNFKYIIYSIIKLHYLHTRLVYIFLNMKFTHNKMENIKIIISFHNMLFKVLVFSTDDCFSIIKMLFISIKAQEN